MTLSQRCPSFGVVEAAGSYCTACLTPTGPADAFGQARKKAQRPATAPSGTSGHSAGSEPAASSDAATSLAGLPEGAASPAPTVPVPAPAAVPPAAGAHQPTLFGPDAGP